MMVSADPPATLRDAPLPLASLLPLRAAVITLRFTEPSSLHFFHPPALTAFLRTLLGSPADYDIHLTLDAPESGRTVYRAGDDYRFTLFCLASSEALMQTALERLMALPGSTLSDPSMPFRDNLVFLAAHDLFLGHAVKSVEGLSSYTLESLEQEAALWSQAQGVLLRWLSPVRLLRPKETRQGLKGEARYCHTRHEVSGELLFNRLHDALADLLRRRGQIPPPRGPAPVMNDQEHDLFWVDSRYHDAEGREQVMGGLMGIMGLVPQSPLTPEQWQCLVLGQYLGIGQRRAFGWGCYRLETDEGETTCVRADPAASLLTWIVEEANLASAYHAIRANLPSQRRPPMEGEEWEELDEEILGEDLEDEEAPADRLARLGERLRTGEYAVPNLRGVIVREPEGDLRPLTIPPFIDRVAQRAVAQTLSPGLEQLMYHGSFGYRPRRSRESARAAIQAAYREGYRWVYESDIDDFFDTVDWERLKTRLIALYGDDPLIALILGWMAAPVEYQGEVIARRAGLPQGAPLSPLLANLMLDDFDADLEHGGFRLVRFADDFVVLCKDRAEAEAAARAAAQSLADLGLRLNPGKSQILPFAQGFRYLGYLFVDSLALDVSGEKAETAPAAASVTAPPHSWLARLASRTPQILTADGQLRPAEPSAPAAALALAADLPLRLGESEDQGTVLFVTGRSALLSTSEGRLQVEREEQTILSLPWSGLHAVALIGPHHLTTPALKAALKHEVPIHFASHTGRYQGVTWSGRPGMEGYQLWLEQQRCFSDPVRCLGAARSLIEARLRHQREVLRQRAVGGALAECFAAFDRLISKTRQAASRDELNGFEGQATRLYYEAMKLWIPEVFGFDGRNRQPPRDPFNALLSLGYTVLYAHVETVLRVSGLLPWIGFYHQAHGRHAALASDLMEPFRHLVERTALAAVTRGSIVPEDFYLDATEGCQHKPEARRRYLAMLAERFDTPLTSVLSDTPKTLHEHLCDQNLVLIAWIRGKIPEFKAWRMR